LSTWNFHLAQFPPESGENSFRRALPDELPAQPGRQPAASPAEAFFREKLAPNLDSEAVLAGISPGLEARHHVREA
jgi:hypothetical protein